MKVVKFLAGLFGLLTVFAAGFVSGIFCMDLTDELD